MRVEEEDRYGRSLHAARSGTGGTADQHKDNAEELAAVGKLGVVRGVESGCSATIHSLSSFAVFDTMILSLGFGKPGSPSAISGLNSSAVFQGMERFSTSLKLRSLCAIKRLGNCRVLRKFLGVDLKLLE